MVTSNDPILWYSQRIDVIDSQLWSAPRDVIFDD